MNQEAGVRIAGTQVHRKDGLQRVAIEQRHIAPEGKVFVGPVVFEVDAVALGLESGDKHGEIGGDRRGQGGDDPVLNDHAGRRRIG